MGKYTSDDNRSMQLNDNNERYWSSRGIDLDDNYGDDDTKSVTYPVSLVSFSKEVGRAEYERMKCLYPIWKQAVYDGQSYESYKDAKNEYRRLKRWLNKNTHDLHEQLYWEH